MKQALEQTLNSVRTGTRTELAFKISLILRREIGLPPCEAEAKMGGGVLSVRLFQALTPMARLIVRTEGGGPVVQGAYQILLDDCRERLHATVARIVGLPVRRSGIEVDAASEDVRVWFELYRDLRRETNG